MKVARFLIGTEVSESVVDHQNILLLNGAQAFLSL